MPGKELKAYSVDELRQQANELLEKLNEPHTAEMATAMLLQYQLYMSEVDRRENVEIAERDFAMAERSNTMETWVIVLIGAELVLALITLLFAWREGVKQQAVLTKMQDNSQTTADTLTKLSEDQTESLARQKETNDKLQGSIEQTGVMVTAMKRQLKILETQQAEHTAAPKLELRVRSEFVTPHKDNPFAETLLLTPDITAVVHIGKREDRSRASLSFYVRNTGNATAENLVFSVSADESQVKLVCNVIPWRIYIAGIFSPSKCPAESNKISARPVRDPHRQKVIFRGMEYDPSTDLSVPLELFLPARPVHFVLRIVMSGDRIPDTYYALDCQFID